uniref:Long-chain-fatty-acid--CoA ligase n=1 Tax=uncultured bacterium esnapd14 TaxID=1366594 RepID=S5UCP2_9BACT|nr:long-chain-fatty-acid--CoA ligase [uncultured bacterium esnapd14]
MLAVNPFGASENTPEIDNHRSIFKQVFLSYRAAMPSAPPDSMQLDQLLRELGELRVELHAEGGRLRCVAPVGVLTPDLLSRVRDRRTELLRWLSATPGEREAAALSYAQERIWLHQQLDPGGSAYHIPLDIDLIGSLSPAALRHALSVVIARHEPLRTTFRVTGSRPEQTVLPPRPATLPVVDLTGLPPAAQARQRQRVGAEFARRPFDLATSPGMRQALLRSDTGAHQLLLTRHHLTSDGWSFGVLATDLGRAYGHAVAGRPVCLPALPWRYRDFIRWQRATAEAGGFDASLRRWQAHLAGSTFVSGGLGRWSSSGAGPAAVTRLRLRGGVPDAIHVAARKAGTTAFTVMATAFGLALAAVTRAPDAVIGIAASGRTRPETEPLVGSFATVLPLRVNARHGTNLHEALLETHRTLTQVIEDQDVPLEHILRAVAPRQRWFGRQPPFAAVLTYQNTPGIEVWLPRLEALLRETAPMAPKFPLALTVNHVGQELELVAEHDRRTLDEPAVTTILRRLISILDGNADQPAQPVTTDTAPEVADSSTLAERFEAVAARRPDAVAICDTHGQVSFRALRRRARLIARALLACGVRPGGSVAVCAQHDAYLVAAIIGVGLAGAAYVPLDPDDPAVRHESVMADAQVDALVTTQRWRDRFAWLDRPVVSADRPQHSSLPLPGRRSADQIAYIIYTSGSTGAPKGVMVSHRNVLGLLGSARQRFGFTESDTWSMTHSAAFDFSVWELWVPLLTGGRVVIVPRERVRDIDFLRSTLERERVTVHSSTPSAFDALVHAAGVDARTVVLGGERCDPARLGRWLDRSGPHTQLVNMYGITETTVHVTHRVLTRFDAGGTASPIGGPLPGVRLTVTESGELVVGGWGVAHGYLRRPGLTAGRFLPDELGPPGARAYRSGDLVMSTVDGELCYLGRQDAQVKVRGYRVEPEEVAAALRTHPRVCEAVVVPAKKTGLAAYVVAETGHAAPTTQDLRRFLLERLPGYMVPTHYVAMEALPLNRNGKLDLAALPPAAPADAGDEQPRTATEAKVAQLWCELLELNSVGVHDDFFLLGGDSLLVTRMHARLQEIFGIEVPMRLVYEAFDVAALAALLEGLRADQTPGAS